MHLKKWPCPLKLIWKYLGFLFVCLSLLGATRLLCIVLSKDPYKSPFTANTSQEPIFLTTALISDSAVCSLLHSALSPLFICLVSFDLFFLSHSFPFCSVPIATEVLLHDAINAFAVQKSTCIQLPFYYIPYTMNIIVFLKKCRTSKDS